VVVICHNHNKSLRNCRKFLVSPSAKAFFCFGSMTIRHYLQIRKTRRSLQCHTGVPRLRITDTWQVRITDTWQVGLMVPLPMLQTRYFSCIWPPRVPPRNTKKPWFHKAWNHIYIWDHRMWVFNMNGRWGYFKWNKRTHVYMMISHVPMKRWGVPSPILNDLRDPIYLTDKWA
jgi:hypothetical protein